MTWLEILFWILVIILLAVLYGISTTTFWVILIIAIIWFIIRVINITAQSHTQPPAPPGHEQFQTNQFDNKPNENGCNCSVGCNLQCSGSGLHSI